MDEEIRKYLFDIKNSIESINEYLEEGNTFKHFLSQKMRRRAIEREFEIIDEAVNKAFKLDATLEISNYKKIIGLRNYIIHAYDQVLEEIFVGNNQERSSCIGEGN